VVMLARDELERAPTLRTPDIEPGVRAIGAA